MAPLNHDLVATYVTCVLTGAAVTGCLVARVGRSQPALVRAGLFLTIEPIVRAIFSGIARSFGAQDLTPMDWQAFPFSAICSIPLTHLAAEIFFDKKPQQSAPTLKKVSPIPHRASF